MAMMAALCWCCVLATACQAAAFHSSWSVDGDACDPSQWRRSAFAERTMEDGTLERNTTVAFRGTEAMIYERLFVTPPAAETLLRFRQTSGTSPRLSEINTLDVTIPVPDGAHATLHGFAGSAESSMDYSENELELLPGAAPAVRVPVGGRSSNGILPLFAIHLNGTSGASSGMVLSVGWSGSWRVSVGRSADGKSVRVQAGLALFNASLQSGRSFRGARILCANYTGDVRSGWNVHRHALARHFLQKDSSGRVRGGLVSAWTAQTYHSNVNEADMLAMVKGVKAAAVEAAWIDFGWYIGGGLGDVGNWVRPPQRSVDATKFPHGLSAVAKAAHAGAGSSRTQFIVWTEPERTAASAFLGPLPWSYGSPLTVHRRNFSTENFTIHSRTHKPAASLLVDLGNPEVLRYMTAYLSEAVKTFDLDVLRMDFNIDPAASWALKDTQQARASEEAAAAAGATSTVTNVGLSEVAHVEGLYNMWRSVIQDHPDVLLDNCASGGRRIDLETATLSTPLWQSDLAGNRGDTSESWQSQTMGLSCFLPVHSGGCPRFDSHTTSGPTGEPGLTTAVEPYVWRSCGTVGKAIAWTPAMWAELAAGSSNVSGSNSSLARGVRTAVAETQRMRAVVVEVGSDYYPLTPINPLVQWAAYEHITSNGSKGFALVFRRPMNMSGGGHASRQPILRLVTNRSRFTWTNTAPAGSGYYVGDYYFTPGSKASATLEACQAVCSESDKCEGFTFVRQGGPPCALYSAIVGPFRETRSNVTQLVKRYDCGLARCAFGLNTEVQPAVRHPLPLNCATFIPNCASGEECNVLSAATDGSAGCPPYHDMAHHSGDNATAAEFTLKLRGLLPSASYEVSYYHDSYEQTASQVLKGNELAELAVTMPARSVLLLWFSARDDDAR